MGDLSAELLVLHHKNFQFLDVVYKNLSETDWEHVLGGFVYLKMYLFSNVDVKI